MVRKPFHEWTVHNIANTIRINPEQSCQTRQQQQQHILRWQSSKFCANICHMKTIYTLFTLYIIERHTNTIFWSYIRLLVKHARIECERINVYLYMPVILSNIWCVHQNDWMLQMWQTCAFFRAQPLYICHIYKPILCSILLLINACADCAVLISAAASPRVLAMDEQTFETLSVTVHLLVEL